MIPREIRAALVAAAIGGPLMIAAVYWAAAQDRVPVPRFPISATSDAPVPPLPRLLPITSAAPTPPRVVPRAEAAGRVVTPPRASRPVTPVTPGQGVRQDRARRGDDDVVRKAEPPATARPPAVPTEVRESSGTSVPPVEPPPVITAPPATSAPPGTRPPATDTPELQEIP